MRNGSMIARMSAATKTKVWYLPALGTLSAQYSTPLLGSHLTGSAGFQLAPKGGSFLWVPRVPIIGFAMGLAFILA